MWAAHHSYYEFFREVAQLPIDWAKWMPWNRLGEISGFRWMHEEFCIVSEKPIAFHVNDQNEAHNENGPYIEWADGSAIYAVNGVMVPGWIIEAPEDIMVSDIDKCEDMEVKRVMMEKYGVNRYLTETKAKILDISTLNLEKSPTRALMETADGSHWMVTSDGSTSRVYHLPVVGTAKTCKEAHEMIGGLEESHIIAEA